MTVRLKIPVTLLLTLLTLQLAAQVPVLDSVCYGSEGRYGVTGEPGSTYTWNLTDPAGNQQLLPSTADTAVITWLGDPGVYLLEVVQYSTNGCAADPVQAKIIVLEPPSVFAGIDQTIANGTSTTIGDASIAGVEPLAFIWTPSGLLIDPTALHPTTVHLYVTTEFVLTLKDGRGCENSDTVVIIVEGGSLAVDPAAVPDQVCLGGSSQLFANASGGSGVYYYSWTSNPPGFVSNDPDPMVSPVTTTTYTVEVFDGYNTVSGSVTLTVNALPLVNAGTDQIIMSGTGTVLSDATASGSGPLTYSWEPAALLIDPTELHPTTVTLFANTTFTLTVTDIHECESSDIMTVFIQTEPLAVDPFAIPEEICLNSYSLLFANPSGGSGNYSFAWTSDPPGFFSTTENPVVSPTETTTYIVELYDGFNLVTGSATVIVHPLPEVYAGDDQTINYGNSATISDATATGAAPLTYQWEPAALLLDPTVLNPVTVALFATTTFTLTVNDANGCEQSDEVMIIVQGGPLAVEPSAEPDVLCAGDTVQLRANATGGSGLYTYSWTSDPPGFTSTDANPSASPDETTVYTVTVGDGTGYVSGSVTVVVNAVPEVYAGSNRTIPFGTSTTIDDAMASGTAPLTFDWQPAAFLVDATVLRPTTVNLTATVTFTLTVYDGNGCQDNDVVMITVEGEALDTDPLAIPDNVCLGDEVQLFARASGGSGSYDYTWTSDPPGFTSSQANPSDIPAVTMTYFVQVDDGYNTANGQVTVEVYPVPEVTCPEDTAVCSDEPAFELTQAQPPGGVYTGEGVFFVDDLYYFDPSAGEGTYPVKYLFSNGYGCTDSCTFNITVNANPVVVQTVVTDETDGLHNGAIEIIATASTSLIYYSIDNGINWQMNNGLFEALAAGTYPCVVMDGNGCDTSFTVTIQNIILTFLEAITDPNQLCLGQAATVPLRVEDFTSVASFRLKLSYNVDNLTCAGCCNVNPNLENNIIGWVNQAQGEIIVTWHGVDPVTLPDQETIIELAFTTKLPGQGQLDWYINPMESYFLDSIGNLIPAQFYAGQVTIYEPPVILLPAAKSACEGETVILRAVASTSHPPVTYRWTCPDGHTQSEDPIFPAVSIDNAGDYTLLATDSTGCTDQKNIRLVVSENPVADFHGTDTLIVAFGYILDAGPGYASYIWSTGETSESINIYQEGWYFVEMESHAGCIGIDSVFIIISEEVPRSCLLIPNAFSPNSDGLNDLFRVHSTCEISDFHMFIFNRWGEELFESDNITIGWDGTKNGTPCPGDVYVYKIVYKIVVTPDSDKEQMEAGTVMLLK